MIRLNIPDMNCGHCVRAVTQAVRTTDPQAMVNIDLGAGTAEIDTQAPPRLVAEAIEQAGYPNRPLPE